MQSDNKHPKQQRQLEDAFLAFNQVSEQLVESYHQLQSRVAILNRELNAARSERMRQLAEKEILANRLSKLLDALPAGVVVVGPDERLQQINPVARSMLQDVSIDLTWDEIRAQSLCDTSSDGEYQLPSGRLVNLTEKTLYPESGRIILLLDITERREMQERLDRQQRLSAMGEMAAQLAHQIRTPLSSALLYTSNLSRSDLTTEQRHRFSERCKTRLHHMERQINDMLAFARGGQFEPERVSLSGLLDELANTLVPLFNEQDARIRILDHTDGSVTIQGNGDALLGAFANLANNSLDHVGSGVSLVIEAHQHGERIELLFADDGPGIDRQIHDQIFDPFFTTRGDGTGLGLAIVQLVVLGHQGQIALFTPPQGGAGFRILLPCRVEPGTSVTRQPDIDVRGAA